VNPSQELTLYVSCPPGLEPALAEELKALRIRVDMSPGAEENGSLQGEEPGGFEFKAALEDIYRCNLNLRVASRVVVRLGTFHAAAFSELRKKGSRLPWDQFLSPGINLHFKVTCHKSKLYHTGAVAERVLGAIQDHFHAGETKTFTNIQDKPGQLVLVRLDHDMCTISIDSSGELLHRRGYRLETAKAPLRENLAAGILRTCGWNGTTPLIDPFCGSGTFPIEAGLIANHIPPGLVRTFEFVKWPIHQAETWQNLLQVARLGMIQSTTLIQGADRDRGAISSAKANAARAGLLERITFLQQPISELAATDSPGWIITNPPYGVRVSAGKDLRDLYARLGSLYRERFQGWKLGIVCNDPVLIANLGMGAPSRQVPLVNGGIPVQLSIFE
jgi:putative N6-adenine-specific DNA methylase